VLTTRFTRLIDCKCADPAGRHGGVATAELASAVALAGARVQSGGLYPGSALDRLNAPETDFLPNRKEPFPGTLIAGIVTPEKAERCWQISK
jgi:hypothetical protein